MLSALRTYHGLAMASKQSGKAFIQALKTGQVRLDVDFQTLEATDKAIGGIVGEVLRLPTRLLAAEDEFFNNRRLIASTLIFSFNDLEIRLPIVPGSRSFSLQNSKIASIRLHLFSFANFSIFKLNSLLFM